MTASTSPATRGILRQKVYKVEADWTTTPARPIKPAILDARSILEQGKESSRMQTSCLEKGRSCGFLKMCGSCDGKLSTEVPLPHLVRPTRMRHSRSRPYLRLDLAAATSGLPSP